MFQKHYGLNARFLPTFQAIFVVQTYIVTQFWPHAKLILLIIASLFKNNDEKENYNDKG